MSKATKTPLINLQHPLRLLGGGDKHAVCRGTNTMCTVGTDIVYAEGTNTLYAGGTNTLYAGGQTNCVEGGQTNFVLGKPKYSGGER